MRFTVSIGPGFITQMLHCDRCGKGILVQGMIVPRIESNLNQTKDEYAVPCECGGSFTRDAPPRCPKCGSTEYDEADDGLIILYD